MAPNLGKISPSASIRWKSSLKRMMIIVLIRLDSPTQPWTRPRKLKFSLSYSMTVTVSCLLRLCALIKALNKALIMLKFLNKYKTISKTKLMKEFLLNYSRLSTMPTVES
jgi:hypothetical protein